MMCTKTGVEFLWTFLNDVDISGHRHGLEEKIMNLGQIDTRCKSGLRVSLK